MSAKTGIQWCDATWNPVVGCDRVSPGCAHCYAKELHDKRNKAYWAGKNVAPQYAQPFEAVQLMPSRLDVPRHWRKPRRVFVNSVADLFHDDVPDEFISKVFIVMAECERHTFQILTKRPARMLRWFTEYLPEACSGEQPAPVWPLPNVWLGVSVENQRWADERIPLLMRTPAAVRFLSCEPLLGPMSLRRAMCRCPWFEDAERTRHHMWCPFFPIPEERPIDWAIIGGESGSDARPFDVQWARDIVRDCRKSGITPFVKQMGTKPYDSLMAWKMVDRAYHPGPVQAQSLGAFAFKDRHGGDMAEWPEELRVREFPTTNPNRAST